jgi:Holliday junction resolvasome RuvABC ATP-dependent DNA helicase subunit
MSYFQDLIGQEPLKRKLGFYLDAYKTTSRMPFLLFNGAKGSGKTIFMRKTAQNCFNRDGSKRPVLEINCSVIRNNQMFFENIMLQFIRDRPMVVAFDECHNLPRDLSQALLTICNTEKDHVRDFAYNDATYTFDFTKLVFMFATTEPDKLFPPLKDRFDIVDFESYSNKEVQDILVLNCDSILFLDNILEVISHNVRGNARSCVKMAEQIETYCKKFNKTSFGAADWKSLCYHLNILPFGLTSSELMVLRVLDTRGSCSLNMLASATGLSRSAIMNDVERHLLKSNLMKIDGQRKITNEGQKLLLQIKASV